MLFVHNTFADKFDLESIKHQNANAYLCACATANLFIENTLPNYNLWFANFENICLGTDSLASNYSLSIWDEIKTIQHNFPDIPFETILKCATLNGAKFLNIDDWAGSIAVGKRPGINVIKKESCTKII
jgi:cytosine/adenosine deaminase-related metal-dependent hydrolase